MSNSGYRRQKTCNRQSSSWTPKFASAKACERRAVKKNLHARFTRELRGKIEIWREKGTFPRARAELTRRKPASRKLARAGNPRCAKTRESVAGVREGSTKDVVDSCGMEAAPRRHNITILGRPPRARGGRRHGKEAGGLRPLHTAISPGWQQGGVFKAGSRGNDVGTPGVCALRRRLCGFPFVFFFLNISLSLCLLRKNSSFSLYHGCRLIIVDDIVYDSNTEMIMFVRCIVLYFLKRSLRFKKRIKIFRGIFLSLFLI